MKSLNIAFITGLLSMSASVAAEEIVATIVEQGGGTRLALDLNTEGGVAGFSFSIKVPGARNTQYDLGRCVAELPAGFDGACSLVDDKVYVFATASRMEVTLPAGIVPIGRIELSRGQGKAGAIEIGDLSIADARAVERQASGRVVVESVRGQEGREQVK
jgi:hypothetical protein